MTHLINHLQCDIYCAGEDEAFEYRLQTALSLTDVVTEVVERVCPAFAREDQWIVIDKLEIDLGRLRGVTFSADLAAGLQLQLEKALVRALQGTGEKLPGEEVSPLDLLQFILLNGRQPWWATAMETDLHSLCRDVLQTRKQEFTGFLLRYRYRDSLWQRITWQLDDALLAEIIALLPALTLSMGVITQWIKDTRKRLNLTPDLPENQDTLLRAVIVVNAPALFLQQQDLSIPDLLKEQVPVLFPGVDPTVIFSPSAREDKLRIITNPPGMAPPGEGIPEGEERDTPEKHFVQVAGIVLLAPFFTTFFTRLGLWGGSDWKDKGARYRAVHLLKYLSTGLQGQGEHTLVLEKVCCGVAIDEPVPMDIPLEENEIQEAAELLDSVIAHWGALKNTSVKGLQESFLKREGILSPTEKGWLLQVEKKTMDVLMEGIPWNYSSVSLPWNDYLITVEW